jgi:hypothetical protein
MDKWQIPIQSAGILTLIILLSLKEASAIFIAPAYQNPGTVVAEDPIEKNVRFQLYGGETYVYGYVYNGTPLNISFLIADAPSCTMILVMENPSEPGVCVDEWGNDRTMSNSSLEHPQILLFKPWMLALEQGWTWKTKMYLSYNGTLQEISSMEYKVVRMDEYRGRQAYVVKETTDGGGSAFSYIDVEKRVLLKLIGEGFEITLEDAPFLDDLSADDP